jgi:hypothetical protein
MLCYEPHESDGFNLLHSYYYVETLKVTFTFLQDWEALGQNKETKGTCRFSLDSCFFYKI